MRALGMLWFVSAVVSLLSDSPLLEAYNGLAQCASCRNAQYFSVTSIESQDPVASLWHLQINVNFDGSYGQRLCLDRKAKLHLGLI